MKTVADGVVQQLSVSRVTTADHTQTGGCERRFYFESVEGRRQRQTGSQADGDAGHALLAHFLEHGKLPDGRRRMKTAVEHAVAKGALPKPGPDMLVERRFSGQPKVDPKTCRCGHSPDDHDKGGCRAALAPCTCAEFDARWVPLDVSKTLHVGGVPFDGFIDLAFRRDDVPVVLDHKFSSDIDQAAVPNDKLIQTVQLPLYVAVHMDSTWSDAREFKIVHHYVSRVAPHRSFFRKAVVTRDQVLEQMSRITGVVERIKVIARSPSVEELPFNRKACEAYGGCPHQSICSAYKQEENPKVNLSPEELALFAELDAPAPAPVPTPAPAPTVDPLEAVVPSVTPTADPTLPPPPATKQTGAIMPDCRDCGTSLNPDNASRLRSGEWMHIGCAATTATPAPVVQATAATPAPLLLDTKTVGGNLTSSDPAITLGGQVVESTATPAPVTEPKKRGRPAKPKAEPAPIAATATLPLGETKVDAPIAVSTGGVISGAPIPDFTTTTVTTTVVYELGPNTLEVLAAFFAAFTERMK